MPQFENDTDMNEFEELHSAWRQEMNQLVLSQRAWKNLAKRLAEEDRAFKGERIYYAATKTQIGRILIASSSGGLCRLALPTESELGFWNWLRRRFASARVVESRQKNNRVLEEIEAYISGDLHAFDLPVDIRATPFQRDVLDEIARIPFGKTLTYSEIAQRIGNPVARQAVGAATGSNPIPIVIPCHRVVGADGCMVGYGGGVPLKEWLLHLEGHSIEGHRLVPKGLFS